MAIRKSSNSGIPFGNTANRPANPAVGQPYFNGQENRLEIYTQNVGWQNIVAETPGVVSYTGSVVETNSTNTIVISGTNFTTGAIASLIGNDGTEYIANTTTVNSIVQITAVFGALSASKEPYDIKVVNPSNLYGILQDTVSVNDTPSWTTSAGSLGTFNEGDSVSITVAATDEEGSSLTYSVASGSSLPSGTTLNSSTGVISGTLPNIASDTTYTFTLNVSDGSNSTSRTFSIISQDLDGSTEQRALTSTTSYASSNPSAPAGIYWVKNSSNVAKQVYCDMPNGGWILVASNNANDSTIPAGTTRNSSSYWLSRSGTLGTASPNSDYIIGNWLDNLSFNRARCVAFGYDSTDNSTNWSNKGTFVTAEFPLTTSGNDRYIEIVPRSSLTITGNGINSSAAYFSLDAIRRDSTHGYTSNYNQCTIGIAGYLSSTGRMGDGVYLGHGSTENVNSLEGYYASSGAEKNCQGYTSWVRQV